MMEVLKRPSLTVLLACALFSPMTYAAQQGCYLFVSGKDLDPFQAYQQIQTLVNAFLTPVIEAPSEGIPVRELSKSCYYEAGLALNADQLTLSIKSHRASKELNAVAESVLTFPENVRQAMLRILHRKLAPSIQNELCKDHRDLLPEACPQIPRTVLFYRRNLKSEFSESSKQAVTVITDRLGKMLAENTGIEFTVMAGHLKSGTGSEGMLPLLNQQNATAALVFSLDGDIQQSDSSMWNALAEIGVSVTAFRIQNERLVQTGTLDLSPERIPVRKWGTSPSYREKHFGRAARKLIKKWSEDELEQFIENLR